MAFREADIWKPPYGFDGTPFAIVVFTTRPTEHSAWDEYGEEVSLLTAQFFASCLDGLRQEYLGAEASFVYAVLARAPRAEESLKLERGGAFAEYGFGEAPAAPSEWTSMPISDLLGLAIQWLETPHG